MPSRNLTHLSDWLVKLLLGAGLVQLGAIGRWLADVADRVGSSLDIETGHASGGSGAVVAASLLISNASLGFAVSYAGMTTSWSRLLRNMWASS